jgi:hypothetical protein
MLIRLILSFLVAGMFFASVPVQNDPLPHYWGDWQDEPCKTWNVAHDGRDPARERAADWLAGYISATKVYRVQNALFSDMTADDVIHMLDNFCAGYPTKSVADSVVIRSMQQRVYESLMGK